MKFISDTALPPASTLVPGKTIERVRRGPFMLANILATDGTEDIGTCLHCPDMPCMTYASTELQFSTRNEITYLTDDQVCVFDAMRVRANTPLVDTGRCTGCGLCVSRCPAGAISLGEDGKARVNASPNRLFVQRADATLAEFDHTVRQLTHAQTEWVVGKSLTSEYVDKVMKAVLKALRASGTSKNQVNLLVRNLFLALGFPAKVGVQGDTSSRVDMVFIHGPVEGIAEVEMGEDLLDSARRLMADLAIARARQGVATRNVVPVLVCTALPNARSDVYELLSDIKNVLDLQVRVVPVAGLILWLLYGARPGSVDLTSGFILGKTKKDLIADVRRVLPDQSAALDSAYVKAMK